MIHTQNIGRLAKLQDIIEDFNAGYFKTDYQKADAKHGERLTLERGTGTSLIIAVNEKKPVVSPIFDRWFNRAKEDMPPVSDEDWDQIYITELVGAVRSGQYPRLAKWINKDNNFSLAIKAIMNGTYGIEDPLVKIRVPAMEDLYYGIDGNNKLVTVLVGDDVDGHASIVFDSDEIHRYNLEDDRIFEKEPVE